MKYFIVGSFLLFTSCLVVNTNYDKLPPGPYRGVFYLDGKLSERKKPDEIAKNFDLEVVNRGEMPINFELSIGADSSLNMTIINGNERIDVPDFEYKRLLETARDSITIRFPNNDSYITGYHEAGIIEGTYIDETRQSYRIPFAAFFGEGHRFTPLKQKPAADLSGRWEVNFSVDDTLNMYPAIGEFKQEGNELTGTFLTTTGDYRYLQGTIQENRFYMSAFDGSHVFMFSGKVKEDGSLIGIFRSGTHYSTIWEAKKNPDVQLPDPTKETQILNPESSVQIAALDIKTQDEVSILETSNTKDKIKVVSVMGSWCPNCLDEARFLDSIKQTVDPNRVSFIGLAFEKFKDTSRNIAAIERFVNNNELSYPIYLAGSSNKKEASQKLKFIDRVRSFPTLMIIDEQNKIQYLHTGFTGPATSEYKSFATSFAEKLQKLQAE